MKYTNVYTLVQTFKMIQNKWFDIPILTNMIIIYFNCHKQMSERQFKCVGCTLGNELY